MRANVEELKNLLAIEPNSACQPEMALQAMVNE
jgi:hypothetical protein